MTQPIIPFSSHLLQDMVGTAEMRAIWVEHELIENWMRVERAITESQAELGMIPAEAAEKILQCLSPEVITPELIATKQTEVGHLLVAFLHAFREVCGPAGEHFHLGPTTQDILDTGLTLQIREAHLWTQRSALELEEALCDQALRHRDTVMMGRTHQQHAVPTTLGFLMAGWAAEMRDHIERAREAESRWQIANLTGATGAHNAFVELAGEEAALALQDRVAERLGLAVPDISPHPRLDRFAEVTGHLAGLCAALAKIGLDLRALQRTEVGELAEPHHDAQHFSSTMPNKKNPESSEQVDGLARICSALATAMREVRMADIRDATRLPVEFVSLPQCYLVTSRALTTTIRNIRGLEVNADQMLHNLDHPNALGEAAAERIMIELYKRTGRKQEAHGQLHRCMQRARAEERPLREIVLEDEEIGAILEPSDLDRLCDLATYTGTAARQMSRTLERLQARRADDLKRYALKQSAKDATD